MLNSWLGTAILIMVAAIVAAGQFSRTDNERERDLQRLQIATYPLYRKPTGKELKEIEPSAALKSKFARFLKQDETGLTKLVADRGCSPDDRVVVANEDCLRYSFPGAGASFSFRTKSYRLSRLADITFTEGSFQSLGSRQLGIFVKLGDIPLENVDLSTKGLKFLVGYVPETDFEKGKAAESEFSKGIIADDFAYRRGFFVAANTTFALRSIAFEAKMKKSLNGVEYDESDFDRRRDIIVAFRVVEVDSDGSTTILWRILSEKRAPRMERLPES